MTTNTTSTASQAPAVSISDDTRFQALTDAIYAAGLQKLGSGNREVYALADFLDAKLAQANQRADIAEAIVKDKIETIALYRQELNGLDTRATAAEAKLEAIRHGVRECVGFGFDKDGPNWISRQQVLSLFQQQPKAEHQMRKVSDKWIQFPPSDDYPTGHGFSIDEDRAKTFHTEPGWHKGWVMLDMYIPVDQQPQADESGLPG